MTDLPNIDNIATSKITDVYWVQLNQGADLYKSIIEVAKQKDIKTGMVLNIVGGLTEARLSTPKASDTDSFVQPGIETFSGLMECAGFGTIGYNLDTFDSSKQSGILYEKGEPNVHVHLTIGQHPETHMGHLIEGCIVRSVVPKSHFTIVIAKTEGVVLEMTRSSETTEKYPTGVPVHNLRAVG